MKNTIELLKDYTVEKMVIMNLKRNIDYKDKPTTYLIELDINVVDKLKFIDLITDGYGSYMYNLLKKYEIEKDTLPQNNYGDPKTVSLKAWISRNDTLQREKGIYGGSIDSTYKIGTYRMRSPNGYNMGDYKELSTITPRTNYGYDMLWTGAEIIHQWFHELLRELNMLEIKYFSSVDPLTLKLNELKDLNKSIYFDIEVLNNIINRHPAKIDSDLSVATVQKFIDAFNQVQSYSMELEQELKRSL